MNDHINQESKTALRDSLARVDVLAVIGVARVFAEQSREQRMAENLRECHATVAELIAAAKDQVARDDEADAICGRSAGPIDAVERRFRTAPANIGGRELNHGAIWHGR